MQTWALEITIICAVFCAAAGQCDGWQSAAGQERKLDQTGVQWSSTFAQAMERAKKENRLLMIKMIAGGTNSSGCW